MSGLRNVTSTLSVAPTETSEMLTRLAQSPSVKATLVELIATEAVGLAHVLSPRRKVDALGVPVASKSSIERMGIVVTYFVSIPMTHAAMRFAADASVVTVCHHLSIVVCPGRFVVCVAASVPLM